VESPQDHSTSPSTARERSSPALRVHRRSCSPRRGFRDSVPTDASDFGPGDVMPLLLEAGQRRARGVRQPVGSCDKFVERSPLCSPKQRQHCLGFARPFRLSRPHVMLHRVGRSLRLSRPYYSLGLRLARHPARALAAVRVRHWWSPARSSSIAAPTTQSPADRAGQGSGRSTRPRFTYTTMLRLRGKSNGFGGPLCAHLSRSGPAFAFPRADGPLLSPPSGPQRPQWVESRQLAEIKEGCEICPRSDKDHPLPVVCDCIEATARLQRLSDCPGTRLLFRFFAAAYGP